MSDKIGEHAGPLRPIFTGQPPSFMSRSSGHSDDKGTFENVADEKSGFGFPQRGFGWGRAGEKFAAGKGAFFNFIGTLVNSTDSDP